MKNNIVLIGMPGCGKSTVGVVLAKVTGYEFVDSDLVIQSREKMRLCKIIERFGQQRFNEIEEDVNASLDVEESIIATGGSVVYGPRAMEHLREIGHVVYLKLTLESVAKRLGDLVKRGVSMKPGQTLAELYEERIPLYEKYADVVIEADAMDIRQVVSTICQELNMDV